MTDQRIKKSRTIAVLASLTALLFFLAACSGETDEGTGIDATGAEDESSADTDQTDENESESSESSDASESNDSTSETDDEGSTESAEGDAGSVQGDADSAETTDSAAAVSDDSDGDGDVQIVATLDDLPQVCQDLLGDFLRQMEPKLADFDPNTASFDELEPLLAEFEGQQEEFETQVEAVPECDSIQAAEGIDLEPIIEFAKVEAPGTVSFLQLMAGLTASFAPSTGTGLETCDDAIGFLSDLAAEYDSMQDVPPSELTPMADVARLLGTCTPDQLAALQEGGLTDFMAG